MVIDFSFRCCHDQDRRDRSDCQLQPPQGLGSQILSLSQPPVERVEVSMVETSCGWRGGLLVFPDMDFANHAGVGSHRAPRNAHGSSNSKQLKNSGPLDCGISMHGHGNPQDQAAASVPDGRRSTRSTDHALFSQARVRRLQFRVGPPFLTGCNSSFELRDLSAKGRHCRCCN